MIRKCVPGDPTGTALVVDQAFFNIDDAARAQKFI
jgi:hypothetical protein